MHLLCSFLGYQPLSFKYPHNVLSTTKDAHIKNRQFSEEFYWPQYLYRFGQKKEHNSALEKF